MGKLLFVQFCISTLFALLTMLRNNQQKLRQAKVASSYIMLSQHSVKVASSYVIGLQHYIGGEGEF